MDSSQADRVVLRNPELQGHHKNRSAGNVWADRDFDSCGLGMMEQEEEEEGEEER